MAITKGQLKTAVTDQIDSILGSSVGDADTLSDTQQAQALQAVQDYLSTYDTVNPDVKPTPSIKFRT